MVRFDFVASDGTNVVLREPKMGDAPEYMRLINEVIDEPNSGIMMNSHTGLEEERRWVRGRIEGIRRRRLVMLTAEVDGVIIGNCDVTVQGWKRSHRAMLGIVVVKGMRGKGVGEELMRRTIDLAERRLKGVEFIDLSVLDYNKRAKKLYTKLGFQVIARIPRGIREGKRYYDELLMTRIVRKRR